MEESLKNTGRFVANICTAFMESEYDFWERGKSNSILDRSKTKDPLSPVSAPAFSAADSTFRNAKAAGCKERNIMYKFGYTMILKYIALD